MQQGFAPPVCLLKNHLLPLKALPRDRGLSVQPLMVPPLAPLMARSMSRMECFLEPKTLESLTKPTQVLEVIDLASKEMYKSPQ